MAEKLLELKKGAAWRRVDGYSEASIVTAALKEPLPGWIDNINGPTVAIAGAAKGVLGVVRSD